MITQANLTLLFMALAITLSAQTPAEPVELTSLRQSWQRATKQATGPLDKRYQESLLALKLRLTKEGKLTEALAVESELKKLTEADDESGITGKKIAVDGILGTWSWNSGDKSDQSSIQFEKGGIGNHGGRGNITWRVAVSGDITVTHPSKGRATIRLSADAKSISGVGYDRKPVAGSRIN